MNKILIVTNGMPHADEAARLLCARCAAAGFDASIQPSEVAALSKADVEQLALVVSMGGDGTFLRAARLIGYESLPILGFNYGSLGFLTGNPCRDELELIVDTLSGDVPIEHRSTLDATVQTADGKCHQLTALNELAYTRGASGHVVEYAYAVNGTHIARLKADGLVVATATGSTAYALSSGGPIVSPGYKGLVAVPLAPHTLSARAMVTAPSDVFEVSVYGRSMAEASLFIDGISLELGEVCSITARRGEHEVLMANAGVDFFTNVSQTFFNGGGINA